MTSYDTVTARKAKRLRFHRFRGELLKATSEKVRTDKTLLRCCSWLIASYLNQF